jgi:multimeric flavodoxin WrbA
MAEVAFAKDGQGALENILGRWAPFMRARRRAAITRQIELLINERGARQADQALVIEATRLVVNGGFEPFLHMLEDPKGYETRRKSRYEDTDYYLSKPRIVTRWPSTARPPAKPVSEMKVLAFQASPRVRGNTDILLDEVLRGCLEAGASTEKIYLQKIKMGFCIGCRICKEPGHQGWCTIKDDMAAIYPKIEAADAIIWAFPIYSGRESAQLSTFIDRLDCLRGWEGQRLKPGRRGMLIATWGYPYTDTYDHIIERMATLLNLHVIEPVEALSCNNIAGKLNGWDDKKKAIILRYPQELQKAYQAGRNFVTGEESAGKGG